MMVIYIVANRRYGERFGACLPQDIAGNADAALMAKIADTGRNSPSESYWIVPGTLDPMAD